MVVVLHLNQFYGISPWLMVLPHDRETKKCPKYSYQRTLTVGGGIIAQLVSSFSCLDSTASQHSNNHILYFFAKSNLVKPDTSHSHMDPSHYWSCFLFESIKFTIYLSE